MRPSTFGVLSITCYKIFYSRTVSTLNRYVLIKTSTTPFRVIILMVLRWENVLTEKEASY